jgi:hypothetical protein
MTKTTAKATMIQQMNNQRKTTNKQPARDQLTNNCSYPGDAKSEKLTKQKPKEHTS